MAAVKLHLIGSTARLLRYRKTRKETRKKDKTGQGMTGLLGSLRRYLIDESSVFTPSGKLTARLLALYLYPRIGSAWKFNHGSIQKPF